MVNEAAQIELPTRRVIVERQITYADFNCDRCGLDWSCEHQIRDRDGPDGRRWLVHCRDGVPVRGLRLDPGAPRAG